MLCVNTRFLDLHLHADNSGHQKKTPGVPHAPVALFLGFVFSVLFGGVLTFCGFDELASKIASFVRGPYFMRSFTL